jgi:hypothetical protein
MFRVRISCSEVDIEMTEAFGYFCLQCFVVTDMSPLCIRLRTPLNPGEGPIKLFPSNNLETGGSEVLDSGSAKDTSLLGCCAVFIGK